MNLQIREFALQAGFFPELNYDHTGWHAAGHNELFEKFAELIVRECGEIAYKAYWDNPETVRGIHIKEKIKQHFGVEE